MTNSFQSLITEFRKRLENLYGRRLAQLILFGSHARHDPEPGSDVDLLVLLEGPVHTGEELSRISPITAELSLQYDVLLSCVVASRDRYEEENSPFFLNVRTEGVPC